MTALRRIVRRPPQALSGEWPTHWPEVLRRVHAARGSDARSALPRLADLLPPAGLKGIDAAVDLLQAAIEHDAHILVVGDFDCDGATASAVAVRGLRTVSYTHLLHARGGEGQPRFAGAAGSVPRQCSGSGCLLYTSRCV